MTYYGMPKKSLQDMCIDIISLNFERFFSVYNTTKDPSLKRRFEFLQRKYSYKMATSLDDENRMKAEYADFFINKHLKMLDFGWLKDCSWDTIVSKFKAVGPDLQKVYFSDDYHDMTLQDLMCYLPNLEVLTFHHFCTDEILESIAKFCLSIVEIDVSASELITDEGLKYLCTKENGESSGLKLRKLLITSSSVTDEGVLYFIKNMPSIEIIDYRNLPDVLYAIHKNDLPNINNLKPYNLQNLNLLHCNFLSHFSDILEICLTVCPRVKKLSCPILKQEHLKVVSALPALEKLHLDNNSTSEVQINEMLELNGKKLSSLSLTHVSISVFTLPNSCPLLKYLHLNKVDFKIEDISGLPDFPCLETCIFDSIVYNTESAKSMSLILKSSPKLAYIAFRDCNLSASEFKAAILKCCEERSLQKINFSGTIGVEMNFIQDILLNCHSLLCMILDDCGLNSSEESDIVKIAELLPNNPGICFSDELSSTDSDEFLTNIFDFENELDGYEYHDYFDDYEDDDEDDYDYDPDYDDDDYDYDPDYV